MILKYCSAVLFLFIYPSSYRIAVYTIAFILMTKNRCILTKRLMVSDCSGFSDTILILSSPALKGVWHRFVLLVGMIRPCESVKIT
jgi:hypothetical protein